MRILFVHEVNYLTKPIYEMHEFPEHLAGRGHEIAVWHFPEGYSRRQVRSLGWRLVIPGRAVSAARITLFTPPLSGTMIGRLLTALFAHQLARRVIREFKPDLVVTFSVPTQGWQTVRASKRMGIPIIFRALDVSHKIRKGPFVGLVKRSEAFVYKNATWVSANNPAMLEYCQSMGAIPSRSSVDWPPVDLRRFRSAPVRQGLREDLGVSERHKVILYMGSFFYFSGLPEVVSEFARSSRQAHLVLIGGGEQDSMLKRQVASLGISSRVTFTGYINFEELPSYLKMADVAINPMEPSLVASAAIPNKVIQYLASGLVVVSTRLRGLELSFSGSSGLHFVDSPSQVVKKALELCNVVTNLDAYSEVADLDRFTLSRAIKGFEYRCSEVASIG